MINRSIWLDAIETNEFPTLQNDLEVDVLVIGGGITGVSFLYELMDSNFSAALVERGKIATGVTAKSTAKLNYLQGIVYSKIAKEVSYEAAKLYLESQVGGIKRVCEIIKKERIACDLEKVTSYLYGKDIDRKDMEREYQFLYENDRNVKKEGTTLSVSDTYVFHPVKYVQALAKKVTSKFSIFENTLVSDIRYEKGYYFCQANFHQIKAKYVLLACHYPFELFPFFLPVRTFIEKSYIMANQCPIIKHETFLTTYPNIVSKRYFKNYEILLQGSHNTCRKMNLKNNFQKLIRDSKPDYVWSNEDIMTADNLPFIGRLKENLFLATGYNTWGMATSSIAAFLLKDLFLGRQNKYEEVFSPYREFNLAKLKQYPINIFSNMKSFIGNKVVKKKRWYPKNLTFSMIDGKSVAKYKFHGKEYMVYTTCPHAFCTLLFNEIEKTWDCPCHASRFDITGKCIKGPSVADITVSQSSSLK